VPAFSPNGERIVTASEDETARVWPRPRVAQFTSTQDLVDDSKQTAQRCLTREQRQRAFLEPEPPAWCIESSKWPYNTQDWKDWLRYKRGNQDPPTPDSGDWQKWILAHQTTSKAAGR
jgi:hypothetical protein